MAIFPLIPASACPGMVQRKVYFPDFSGTNTHSASAPGLSSNSWMAPYLILCRATMAGPAVTTTI
jgi:hypothetical protein